MCTYVVKGAPNSVFFHLQKKKLMRSWKRGATARRFHRAALKRKHDGICRIFYDLEDDGVWSPYPRIVSIGAVVEFGGRFRRLVNPERPCSKHASDVHHLSDRRLARAASFCNVWQAFGRFARRAQRRMGTPRRLVLCGWNSAVTDDRKLCAEVARCGERLADLLAVDDMQLAFEDLLPRKKQQRVSLHQGELAGLPLTPSGVPCFALSAVWSVLEPGETTAGAHDALWDAIATRRAWNCGALRDLCVARLFP